MRYVAILLVMLAIAACDAAPSTRPGAAPPSSAGASVAGPERATLDSLADALISAAATDFRKFPPARELQFRDVGMGHVPATDGPTRYYLCGEFSSRDAPAPKAWTRFATILTDPYEQWIGNQAGAFCQDSALVRDAVDDLSDSLQRSYDSQ